jgi:serine/threonine-protein kinase
MAPEQFVTGQSSVQSDIFAVGLILYEMVAGRHPFHRPDAQELQSIRAIQYAEPPPLRDIVPGLAVELESVILRCLEKQPSERYGSAAELREGLKTIVKSLRLDDSVLLPGEGAINMPAQQRLDMETPEEEKRTTGILSMLAEHCGPAVCEPRLQRSDSFLWLCVGRCAGRAAGEGSVADCAPFQCSDECADAAA